MCLPSAYLTYLLELISLVVAILPSGAGLCDHRLNLLSGEVDEDVVVMVAWPRSYVNLHYLKHVVVFRQVYELHGDAVNRI
ncbi:hypothetical protein TKK_0009438 [Trichogramma kaykai]